MNKEEGYIKFQCNWENRGFYFPKEMFFYINSWREKLYNYGLLGADSNGIGFGNLSIRMDTTNCFIITGSATGNYPKLNKIHYSKVVDYDIANNYVKCLGGTKASSESLSHAAIYEASPMVKAIIHTHHKDMWKQLIHTEPTTSSEAEFGTPELAKEITTIARQARTKEKQLIVMGGHEEGILTFGKDIEEAGNVLFTYLEKYTNQK